MKSEEKISDGRVQELAWNSFTQTTLLKQTLTLLNTRGGFTNEY